MCIIRVNDVNCLCIICMLPELKVHVYVSLELPMFSVAGAQENLQEISCEFSLSMYSVFSSCPSSPLLSLSAMGTNGCSSSDDPEESSNTDPNEPYGKGLLA